MSQGEDIFAKVVTEVFLPLYQFMVGVTFLYFFYGVFNFIISLNDPDKKNKGKQHLLWGTIGLFIILSIGGIFRLFNDVFGGVFIF